MVSAAAHKSRLREIVSGLTRWVLAKMKEVVARQHDAQVGRADEGVEVAKQDDAQRHDDGARAAVAKDAAPRVANRMDSVTPTSGEHLIQ